MRHRRALRRRYGRSDAGGGMYMVRFVHKISPSDKDVKGPIHLGAGVTHDKKALAAALRHEGILQHGGSIRSYRTEADGRVVVFPSKSIWWSIILTPQ